MRVGVLISGRGSNLEALVRAFPGGHRSVQICCVGSNREDCAGLRFAREASIPTYVFPRSRFAERRLQQAAMAGALLSERVELVVLAGFDQIVTEPLLTPFAGRIINIHPSLLPAFGSTLHAQQEALAYGVKVSGCTVHYVNEDIDAGPIIAQAAVRVFDSDTVDTLASRILEQEHRLLPDVVKWIAEGRVSAQGRWVQVSEGAASESIAERL
jgi:phosphoribosylglycinamide formyltransferase-1